MIQQFVTLAGFSQATPTAGTKKVIDLKDLPIKVYDKYWAYCKRLWLKVAVTVTQPASGAVAIEWQNFPQVFSAITYRSKFWKTLYESGLTGADHANCIQPVQNGYESPFNMFSSVDIPTTAGASTSTFYLPLSFVDDGNVYPSGGALGTITMLADQVECYLAASTIFGNSATVDNVVVEVVAELEGSQSIRIPTVKRWRFLTSTERFIKVEPEPGTEIDFLALCGNVYGMGGGYALSTYTELKIEKDQRLVPLDPKWLMVQFAKDIKWGGAKGEPWPYDDTAAPGVGNPLTAGLKVLPVIWPRSKGRGQDSKILQQGAFTIYATNGSGYNQRALLRQVDRITPATQKALADLYGIPAAQFEYRVSRPPRDGRSLNTSKLPFVPQSIKVAAR